MTVADDVRATYEPVARAIRRDDTVALEALTRTIRSLSAEHRRQIGALEGMVAESEQLWVTGMCKALLGVIAYAHARAKSNLIQDFVSRRKHVLPVLRHLAIRAREAITPSSEDGAAKFADIAAAVRVKPQNVGELLTAMSEFGLIEVVERSNAKLVLITEKGGDALDNYFPGWQLPEQPLAPNRSIENRKKSIYVRQQFDDSFHILERPMIAKISRSEVPYSSQVACFTMSLMRQDTEKSIAHHEGATSLVRLPNRTVKWLDSYREEDGAYGGA